MPFSKFNWIFEPLVVLFYFPLLVSLGAGAVLKPSLKTACIFSGQISYPLYMTHYAALWMFGNYYTNYKPYTTQLVIVVVSGVILLLGFAYLVMRFYDIPFRKYLSDKRKNRLSK